MSQNLSYPKRVKIALLVVIFIFCMSVLSLKLIDGYTWVEAIYFIIVTLSTVGYGDVTPKSDLTRIISIFLIITGISTLAILSEAVVDKLVSRSRIDYSLSHHDLDYQNHVVILGYTPVSETIALLCRERQFRVCIFDEDEDSIKKARAWGFEAYTITYDIPHNYSHMNLHNATAIYLHLGDDNKTIQVTLNIREMAPETRIFAQTTPRLSVRFGELVGINRTYQRERLIASSLAFSSVFRGSVLFPNQDVPESRIRVLIMQKEFYLKHQHADLIPFAFLNQDFTETTLVTGETVHNIPDNSIMQVATVPPVRKDALETQEGSGIVFRKIWMCGFNEMTRDILHYTDFEREKLHILSFDPDQMVQIEKLGYSSSCVNRSELPDFIEENLHDSDLILNFFDQMTDSLLLNVLVRESSVFPTILQATEVVNEKKLFRKSGANRVLDLNSNMARAMFLILLTDLKKPVSLVSDSTHIFEYQVTSGDSFQGKNMGNLSANTRILLYLPAGQQQLLRPNPDYKFQEGDNLLLYSKFNESRKQATTDIEDHSHHHS